MNNPLVKSPVTDKNGVHTTRNKKAATAVPTRALPPSQTSAYEEIETDVTELPIDHYEEQVTFAAHAIFEAARTSPAMRDKLNHVGHEMLSALGSTRIIIKRQRELIALLEEQRLTDVSRTVARFAPYVLNTRFEEVTGEDGKKYLRLPESKVFGDANPEKVDVNDIRRIAAEWEALAAAVQNYQDKNDSY